MRLKELLDKNKHVRKLRAEQLVKDWHDINGVLHYQGLPYVPEIIKTKLISRHHDNPLVGHFGIEKIQELLSRKYYLLTLRRDVEDYMRGCDICLALKTIRHKPYGDLQSLLVPTHGWKDLLIDFITSLPILTD